MTTELDRLLSPEPAPVDWVARAVAAIQVPDGMPNLDRGAVLDYRASLNEKDRIDFEGAVVLALGDAIPVNVFFGYQTKRQVQAPIVTDRQGRIDMEFEKLQWKAEKRKEKRKPKRVVVMDWLEATKAAVTGERA
jgi:hypothetical protein